jgi:hypothetical protein
LGWHPVEVAQYTFTHKQDTGYRERNIHNNQTKLGHVTIKKLGIHEASKYRVCQTFKKLDSGHVRKENTTKNIWPNTNTGMMVSQME